VANSQKTQSNAGLTVQTYNTTPYLKIVICKRT